MKKRNKMPEIVNIEIMTKCNLKCRHCKLQYIKQSEGESLMSLSRFSSYIEKMEKIILNANELMFSSIEPLIHPNLFEMMDLVSKINPSMSFPIQSNGMFLNDEVIEGMKKRNVPWLSMALDGFDQFSTGYFKSGTDFEKVVKNIKKLRLEMSPEVVIRTVFVSHKDNIDKLPSYVRFCKELGIDAIDVNGLFCFNSEHVESVLYSKEGNNKVEEIFNNARQVASEVGIQIQFPQLKPIEIGCEWKRIFSVDENGDVSPCVLLAKKHPFYFLDSNTDGKTLHFGNIFETDPVDIWYEDKFVEFRNKIDCGNLPNECTLCADGYGVICSNR